MYFSPHFIIRVSASAAGAPTETLLFTIHTLYTIYSDTEIHPGGFMLGRTDYSATQRRRATIFRPATAAAHLTYDRHISERQSLNTIFTRVNPSIRINCVQRAVV